LGKGLISLLACQWCALHPTMEQLLRLLEKEKQTLNPLHKQYKLPSKLSRDEPKNRSKNPSQQQDAIKGFAIECFLLSLATVMLR